MGSSRHSLKRSLFSAVVAVVFFSGSVLAQNSQTTTGGTTSTTNRNTQTSNTGTQRSTPSQGTASTNTNTRSSTSQSSLTLPNLPTGTTGPPPPPLSGFPTLTGTLNTEIPNFPPPTVPPTADAPFMNHSTLPDGTVFIAVGAILGAFGMAILAWRGIVACLLHRSVERAALAQHAANDKSFPAPPAQFYKFLERDPSPVGGAVPAGGRIHRKSHRGPTPSAAASQTNLFFSPTAVPGGGAGITNSTTRDSRYLPSGFYASASPMPGHNAGNSISMSTLRPSSRGGVGPTGSPPDSPDIGPRHNTSSSSVNLNRPPSGNERAPSAFLDDLLDEQGGPQYQGQRQQYPARFPSGPDGQYYNHSPSPPGHRGY